MNDHEENLMLNILQITANCYVKLIKNGNVATWKEIPLSSFKKLSSCFRALEDGQKYIEYHKYGILIFCCRTVCG